MILVKLKEALVEAGSQRKALEAQCKALDETVAQLRAMILNLTRRISAVASSATGIQVPERTETVRTERRDKLDDIADVLRAEGKPLHITMIAERLSEVYGKKVDRTEIEPGINRHIVKVKKRRIEKFGPSTFGLPEWKMQPTLAEIA